MRWMSASAWRPCFRSSSVAWSPCAALSARALFFNFCSNPVASRGWWLSGGHASVVSPPATAAAFSIQSWAQSVLPSTHTALILTMEPVFAWITSFLVMGERLALVPACGAVLILAGIGLTELVPQPHVPSPHEA